MYCYLIRHGQDDESIRGGWSRHSLTAEGRRQAALLAEQPLNVVNIYSSDLPRAMETAEPLASARGLITIPLPAFREANNGSMAGMKHELAERHYPGIYWNTLDWKQPFADGESPKEFYERISAAWGAFTAEVEYKDGNVALITHGGVIQVILSLVYGVPYTNKSIFRKVKNAEIIVLKRENGVWKEK